MIAGLLLAAAAAMPTPARFALVVTYNGGPELSRPSLHYADDDGAKYFEVFSALDRPENVELLTEFDPDSARLFPALSKLAKPPTEANVHEAALAIRDRVKTAKLQGRATEFTFVFAGHGDVDRGRGFISLKGASLDGDGLTALLTEVGADRSHVILDSCNSFFVLNPRGPGRRYATSADISEKLTKQLSNVGVFLSTNAEAEVFEWSELQSGIFSHAVRSGLLGAADADGDGVVSYSELAAFVDRATQDVKNPLFRPKVFARGPGGNDSVGLTDLRQTETVALRVDDPGEVRLTIRDREGLRWIDAYKEAGASLVLRLPAFLAADGTVERFAGADDHRVLSSVALTDVAGTPLSLSALGQGAPIPEARGVDEFLAGLFGEPFGPKAYAQFVKARAHEPVQVFGIGTKEKERMQLLMSEVEGLGRSQRLSGAATGFLGSGLFIAGGAYFLTTPVFGTDRTAPNIAGGCFLGAGVLMAAGGTWALLKRTDEEKVAERFEEELADPTMSPDQVVGHASEALAQIAEKYRKGRHGAEVAGWVLASTGVLALPLGIVPAVYSKDPVNKALFGQLALVGGFFTMEGIALVISARLSEAPAERLERLWREDPDRVGITGVGIAPTDKGGATVGVTGRF